MFGFRPADRDPTVCRREVSVHPNHRVTQLSRDTSAIWSSINSLSSSLFPLLSLPSLLSPLFSLPSLSRLSGLLCLALQSDSHRTLLCRCTVYRQQCMAETSRMNSFPCHFLKKALIDNLTRPQFQHDLEAHAYRNMRASSYLAGKAPVGRIQGGLEFSSSFPQACVTEDTHLIVEPSKKTSWRRCEAYHVALRTTRHDQRACAVRAFALLKSAT